MVPTPDAVLPLLEPLAGVLNSAISDGVRHADALQPDPASRDAYFWSHCARYYSRTGLRQEASEDWQLVEGVPNTGIHIVLNRVHRVRVLRSLDRRTPHAGNGRARRASWTQPAAQQALFLSADNKLVSDPSEDDLPAMNLLIDWHLGRDGEPVVSVSLPRGPWEYEEEINLYWRRPLPSDDEFQNLSFSPPPVEDVFDTLLRIHATENVG